MTMTTESLIRFSNTLAAITADFSAHLDFNQLETRLRGALQSLVDQILTPLLQETLNDSSSLLPALKTMAAKRGLKFCGYRTTRVRIFTGQTIALHSPYFTKAKPKQKPRHKKKRGPDGSGCHLALELFGFFKRTSLHLLSNVVQLALLCPSFEIAKQVLAEQSIHINVKTIQCFCQKLGQQARIHRGGISLKQCFDLKDKTVLVCFDGGRLRERRRKQGKKPAALKRQGYHTDWIEPKLLTIQFLDQQGQLIKEIQPLYDATLGKTDDFFDLLYDYLKHLKLSSAANIVFCADGAPGMWKRLPALMKRLKITHWHECLDYTHAKQNLREIIELVPSSLNEIKDNLFNHWKHLLWNGKWKALRSLIKTSIPGKKCQAALKKFDNYFFKNRSRMQYSHFKRMNLPIGSGAVESAIRRVVNLRLKGAGLFWKREMAETMLFLRSQYLSGRWQIMLENLSFDMRNPLLKDYHETRTGLVLAQAA
jgi:hypothetical protein